MVVGAIMSLAEMTLSCVSQPRFSTTMGSHPCYVTFSTVLIAVTKQAARWGCRAEKKLCLCNGVGEGSKNAMIMQPPIRTAF